MGLKSKKAVAVIGAGPAGLMAAERLAEAGHAVAVIDRMPNVARKFLMAGRGGLNLTHSEAMEAFLGRYGAAVDPKLVRAIEAFAPSATIAWAEGLGQPTFVGTSGRVFPKAMKASPLLRAWLQRLAGLGVTFRLRTEWKGFGENGALQLSSAGQVRDEVFDAVVLALGGASWPRLGADGGWVPLLAARGVDVVPLVAANSGVLIGWSDHVKQKCAGKPLKRIALTIDGHSGRVRGEAVVTAYGLEGGAVYAVSEAVRTALAEGGPVAIEMDLRPDVGLEVLSERLAWAPAKQSLANTLRKLAQIDTVAATLLHETARFAGPLPREPAALAARIKAARFPVDDMAGLARAISTAGGISFAELDDHLMLRKLPGVFAAGEMLDWRAPTGGYLLQACLATGVAAADGVKSWLMDSD